jgi:hypothetical protein
MSKVRHGRRNSRFLCASLLEMTSADGRSTFGVVEDVSERGLCVVVETQLEAGDGVILHESGRDIRATVRHCTTDEAGSCHIGFEFDPDYEWADLDPWPQHRAPSL